MPTAFISVTLSEAGAERVDATPAEHPRFAAYVKRVIDDFFEQTGWHPNRVKPVAGALLYTKYNFLIRFMKTDYQSVKAASSCVSCMVPL